MNGFLGLLTVASLICASNNGPGSDLPTPREVPSQSHMQPVPEPPAPPSMEGKDSSHPKDNGRPPLPPGGIDATLSNEKTGATATISADGIVQACLICPKCPVVGPLTWTGLKPPAPPVVDCRAGAWQQVYVPWAGLPPTQPPPATTSPPLRVGLPWYRRCHMTVCSQGVGNWKAPPSCLFCHCYFCNARCCGHCTGCAKGPAAP